MEAATLPGLARELGLPIKKQGRSWGGATCPVCGDSTDGSNKLNIYVGRDGKWRWRCHACYAHGDAADLIAAAKGVTVRDALRMVKGMPGTEPEVSDDGARQKAVKAVVEKMSTAAMSGRSEVGAYLASRGISMLTLDRAIGRGIVRCLPAEPYGAQRFLDEVIGQHLQRQAGFLKEGAKWSAIAFRPLVGILPGGSAEFRIARQATSGEVKAIRYGHLAWPWWWRVGESSLKRIIVVEGLIDLLSVAQMGIKDGDAIMGLPGASSWKESWFYALQQKHGRPMLHVGLDADDAGDRASDSIIKAATRAGMPAERLRPARKDWNEVLMNA